MDVDLSEVTRFEVIDHRRGQLDSRPFMAFNAQIELRVQDDGRTVKVFVKDPEADDGGAEAPVPAYPYPPRDGASSQRELVLSDGVW